MSQSSFAGRRIPVTVKTPHRCWRLAPVTAIAALAAASQAQTTMLYSTHPEQGGGFGTVVASVTDTNADGKPDVVVGAFNERVGGVLAAGRVTVHSGVTGTILRTLVSPNQQTLGWFGAAVAGVPDVNADSVGDILVGAYNEGNTGSPDSGFGRAYLFSGATGALLRVITSPNQETGGGFGRAVAGIGDVTGDGRGDLVIGAFKEDPNAAPDNAGRVYIFNGATGALYKTLVSPGQSGNGYFGTAVASMPDCTGDGKPDVIASAVGESPNGISGAGRAYIFNANTGLVYKTLISAAPQIAAGFGVSVSGVPDTNGDNRGDVLIGSPLEAFVGRAYLFSGAAGTRLRTFLAGAPEAGDLFGSSVAGLADMNGDGRGDIAIGAGAADPGAAPANAGRAFIYSGATFTFLRSIASPNDQANGGFGTSVAAIGDVNGNGKGDLIVGAPLENTANTDDVGRAYIVRN